MKKLIYAEDLKDSLKYGWVNDKFVLRKIDEAPEVDAVEVIRCKDCNYWEQTEDPECGRCNNLGGLWLNNEFCSDAERKEKE